MTGLLVACLTALTFGSGGSTVQYDDGVVAVWYDEDAGAAVRCMYLLQMHVCRLDVL